MVGSEHNHSNWQSLFYKERCVAASSDNDFLHALGAVVRDLGQQFAAATDSDTLCARVRELRPALVIVDWDLGGDGLNAVRALRELPNGDVPYVVMRVCDQDQDDLVYALDCGVDDLMSQTLSPRQIGLRSIVGVHAFFDRRSLLEERVRLQSLFESSGDFFLLFDQETGLILMSNGAAEKALGRDASELIGHTLDQFFHGGSVLARTKRPDFDVHKELELSYTSKLGAVSVVESRMTPVTLNGVHVMQLHCRDITERKHYQDKLEALTAQLSDENQRLEHSASHDALTGLLNRGAFDRDLERELNLNSRTRSACSVVLMDIDHFKQYNDNLGHLAGDDCLQRVAAAIEASLRRASDYAYRTGGEEFALLLPATPLAGAIQVANQVREGVRALARRRLGRPHRLYQTETSTRGTGTYRALPRRHQRNR